MKIIINGVFKTGTSTLIRTLHSNDIECSLEHCSNINNNTIYLTPIRNQKEIFISGFFQDIHNPMYKYSIFHDEENINLYKKYRQTKGFNQDRYFREKYFKINRDKLFIDKLYKLFVNYNWDNEYHLINKYHIARINKIDNNFNKIPFKKNAYYIYENKEKNIKIVFIDFKILNDINIINNMLKELNINKQILKTEKCNIGETKFYKNEYKILKELLLNNKYFDENYYDFLDNEIYDIK
jgi:hypothetical protein